MLLINRIRIEIDTTNGKYVFDEQFSKGLNFIASNDNTSGKSSVLLAIYYALGLEKLIGGDGDKILSKAYKTKLKEDNNIEYTVLESGVYVEISNEKSINTIYRSGKKENRESKLITVYNGAIDQVFNGKCLSQDYYVNLKNAATNEYGFHTYLEKYLNLKLPMVIQNDGKERKLYLQLIFSALFIEQKRGWADFYSAMPNLGAKEAKKRVFEYILGLETLEISKKKELLKNRKNKLENEWEKITKEVILRAREQGFNLINLPFKPEILDENNINSLKLTREENGKEIDSIIKNLEEEKDKIVTVKPKIIDNFDNLEIELLKSEGSLDKTLENRSLLIETRKFENIKVNNLIYNIQILDNDLQNNKDAKQLKKLGTQNGIKSIKGECPLCQQAIDDSLLYLKDEHENMGIEENIRHLEAQKKALDYTLLNHKSNLEKITLDLNKIDKNISILRKIIRALKNDLYKVDDELSETIFYQKFEIQNKLEEIKELKMKLEKTKKEYAELSKKWKDYLEDHSNLPKGNFSKTDLEKIDFFKESFISNLEKFGFKSDLEYRELVISESSYLPEIDGFDMKFDSSASDHIRTIWSFTLALLQTSLAKNGQHPGVVIFDEPAQHSIVSGDMVALFQTIQSLGKNSQTFIALTMNTNEIKEKVELYKEKSNVVLINSLAFKKNN